MEPGPPEWEVRELTTVPPLSVISQIWLEVSRWNFIISFSQFWLFFTQKWLFKDSGTKLMSVLEIIITKYGRNVLSAKSESILTILRWIQKWLN